MKIKEDRKALLKSIGIKDEDFHLFDAKDISYEYDEKKGVRLYDPYYRTSYAEYIDISGWSAWSCEQDTFTRNILKPARKEAERRKKMSAGPSDEEITQSLQNKFGRKDSSSFKK